MKAYEKHKREFLIEKSFNEINLVINEPNYVGLHPMVNQFSSLKWQTKMLC